MGNLTGCAHVHVKYGVFWKIISTRKLNLLLGTFWHICKMSGFHVVHKELGAKPTSFHKERTGMVLKGIETVGFWVSPGGKSQWVQWEWVLTRLCCTEGDLTGFFNCGTLATVQEKQKISEIENNRTGAILNVPTPMGHLAKIKILECGTIGWQAGG